MGAIVTLSTGQISYSAVQVADRAVTLARLIEDLQEMAASYGEDAVVVVAGYGSGAVYEPVMRVNEPDDYDADGPARRPVRTGRRDHTTPHREGDTMTKYNARHALPAPFQLTEDSTPIRYRLHREVMW